MIGVIDVGGGERGCYGAGVFDWCLEQGIAFDYCVGVSAGAANLCSYLGKQIGRNFAFYTAYSFRKEYMGAELFLRTGQYVDLDYIYGVLSNSDGEYPLDFQNIIDSPAQFVIVATDANTGLPVYFTKNDMSQDDYAPIKASSALPFASRPYPVNGLACFDGGLSDPVPVSYALDAGCEKVVVILTRPRNYRRTSERDKLFAKAIERTYPATASALRMRASLYNRQVDLAEELEREGKVLIVAPDDIGKMSTLTKDRAAIETLYAKGLRDARAIYDFLE